MPRYEELTQMFRRYRKEHAQIAKELGYPRDVVIDILNSGTEEEIDKILRTARVEACEHEDDILNNTVMIDRNPLRQWHGDAMTRRYNRHYVRLSKERRNANREAKKDVERQAIF